MTDKIEKFIFENKLDFSGEESELNSNCVIICGYADYLEIYDMEELFECFTKTHLSPEADTEMRKVFSYTCGYTYGDFWKTEEARQQYIF